jgi:primosomal protein N' (replication factor Y) (superfamily II helicase)
MNHRYAEVIVDIHNRKVDRSFHYAVPENLQVKLGSKVMVPFNNRVVEGTVVGFSAEAASAKVKSIASTHGQALHGDLIHLARWMADYYICPFIQALHTVMPAPLSTKQEVVVEPLVALEDPGLAALSLLDPELGQVFLAVHKSRKPVKLKNLTTRLGKEILPEIQALADRGLVRMDLIEGEVRPRRRAAEQQPYQRQSHTLTEEQLTALKEINTVIQQQGKTVLLHGVTGSGKTEVYLQTIDRILEQGKCALVLVPEISLTPQIYGTFSGAFPGRVAVFHSALSSGERIREYQRVLAGEARVVVGARSAIFAPVENLGLIIIDEEHEQTYKQEESPKYHVREVARKRAELCGCTVILGSATPSLESYALALLGKYKLVTMRDRVAGRPLPPVEVVDMREELLSGNRAVFSRSLTERLEECLSKGEQAILFLNRRGFSTFIVCRACGYVAKCPHCDIALTFHVGSNKLKCHYCNYNSPAPQDCPACNGKHIRYFGLGTQRVEQELKELFPQAAILRMDADSTGKKGSHKEILAAFQRGEAQVLIGTQMVAKGLDFPKVTLVGVVSADSTLNMPDFRAKERTFQLLTQVSGRAGRGVLPGQVVVQTFSPEDPSVVYAQEHDYVAFFNQEIKFRKALGYPPFNHLLRVVISSEDENRVIKNAQDLGGALRQGVSKYNNSNTNQLEILGPAPSPLSKLKNRYRWQVILKGKSVVDLKEIMGKAIKDLYEYSVTGGISLSLDLDPMGIM